MHGGAHYLLKSFFADGKGPNKYKRWGPRSKLLVEMVQAASAEPANPPSPGRAGQKRKSAEVSDLMKGAAKTKQSQAAEKARRTAAQRMANMRNSRRANLA